MPIEFVGGMFAGAAIVLLCAVSLYSRIENILIKRAESKLFMIFDFKGEGRFNAKAQRWQGSDN